MAKLALVVDDSMVIRKLVCQTLKGASFETIEASNGRDGLALTAKHASLALIITDPELRIGGMNHFMLPDGDSEARIPACFGIHAMELVINKMMRLGAARERLVAKLFGASELRDHSTIARNNADFVVSFLEAEGIPIVARKLGSKLPLSIFFDTHTGGVRVKSVGQVKQVEREEVAHLARISKGETSIAEDITIFGEGAA